MLSSALAKLVVESEKNKQISGNVEGVKKNTWKNKMSMKA